MRLKRLPLVAAVSMLVTGPAAAEGPAGLSPEVQRFVAVDARRVVLTHVRVIDGTGAPSLTDRNVVIENGRIASIGPGAAVAEAKGQAVLERPGYSVLPGLVGMHDHLYHIARPNLRGDGGSEPPLIVPQMTFSAPRLYLAAGVTTIRTTGSVEPYADLNLARAIEEGRLPGPHVEVTAPYLEGAGSPFLQMHALRDAADARRTVEYWADQGATSFKAYMYITRDELAAAIETAHARGLKVTGHLCSVTYPEAAALGIDDLEHGFFVDTELDPGKKPDACPASMGGPTLSAMAPDSDAAKRLFALLVERHVAVTSTLPVFEHRVPNRPPLQSRVLEVMSPQAREAFLIARSRRAALAADGRSPSFAGDGARARLRRGRRAAAGRPRPDRERRHRAGLLRPARARAARRGGLLAGRGDPDRQLQRRALPRAARPDRLARARQERRPGAGEGRPVGQIDAIENVELVFKDGVGYDPAKLIESVRGRYGQY